MNKKDKGAGKDCWFFQNNEHFSEVKVNMNDI